MSEPPAPLIAVLLIGGIVSGLNEVLGFVAVVTAATSLCVRYAGVLLGYSKKRIDRMTAVGFYFGLLISAVLYVIDEII